MKGEVIMLKNINSGDSCELYKICKRCGLNKWYKLFESNGRKPGKRKSYCYLCKHKPRNLSNYSFNTKKLKRQEINAQLLIRKGKKIDSIISYEDAVKMVDTKMAGIVNEGLIHQLYSGKVFKQMVLDRDGYTCFYCKEYGLTIDHVMPKSKGGITSFENCVCSCKKCNSQKGSLKVEEYKY